MTVSNGKRGSGRKFGAWLVLIPVVVAIAWTATASILGPPLGACCVVGACSATNDELTCEGLAGEWFEGESCPDFPCELRLDSASIEFGDDRDLRLRHSSIEFETARDLRLRNSSIEFTIARDLRLLQASIEFECDPGCDKKPGSVSCDDCNLTGVPDGCDIDAGTSVDVDPVDGIPDECTDARSGAASIDWTDGDNWNLDGRYPDNDPANPDGVPGQSVTLFDQLLKESVDLLVDDDIEIDTLRLPVDSRLFVTQTGQGDFTVVDAGGISIEGPIFVANDRAIDASASSFLVAARGRYAVDPDVDRGSVGDGCDAEGQHVCTSLVTGSMTINQGPPGDRELAGHVLLEGSMAATVNGDLLMDGTDACTDPAPCEYCAAPSNSQRSLGGATPPVLFAKEGSVLAVFGSMRVAGTARIVLDSINPVTIGGDFINYNLHPECFDASEGAIVFGGAPGRGLTSHEFEVGGRNLGATFDGFDQGTDTNFSLGRLEVAPGHTLTFVDRLQNLPAAWGGRAGGDPPPDALYLGDLVLGAGSSITLEDVPLYYKRLDEGVDAEIILLGDAELVSLCDDAAPPAPSAPTVPFEVFSSNRYLSFAAGEAGKIQAVRVTFVDLPSPHDVFEGGTMWVGAPRDISEIGGLNDATPPTFTGATLEPDALFMDWNQIGTIHVYHEFIVPDGVYHVQVVTDCVNAPESSFSAPLALTMSKWGDCVGDCTVTPCTAPNATVEIIDVLAVIQKFISAPGSVTKPRADLEPCIPDQLINITDALSAVTGFQGLDYPFEPGLHPCPTR